MRYPMKTVYLAGPIVGLEYGAARHSWRKEFDDHLHGVEAPYDARRDYNDGREYSHIHCLSPMRGRRLMDDQTVVYPGMEFDVVDDVLETAKGILARDSNDVRNCDLLVANVLGAKTKATGTTMELGLAYAWNKPIVLIMEPEGNVHHHGFVTSAASFWVHDIAEAVRVVQTLLTPGI